MKSRLKTLSLRLSVVTAVGAWLPAGAGHTAAKAIRRLLRPTFDGLSPEQVRALARDAAVGRPILLARTASATAVLARVDTDAMVGPVMRWLLAQPGDGIRDSLYATVTLNRLTATRPQLHVALLATARRPDVFSVSQQRGLLQRALTLAVQPIDPYEPDVLSFAARNTAAALMQRNPALDPTFVERLGEAGDASDDLLGIQGAALQARSAERTDAILATLKVWKPGPEACVEFAKQCDQRYSAADPVLAPTAGIRRWVASTWAWLALPTTLLAAGAGLLAAILAGPAVAAASVEVRRRIGGSPPDLALTAGEILAALGILVAAHVVASQLAADRLPGLIARFTSTPRFLLAGYSIGVTLLAANVIHYPHRASDQLAVQLGLTIGLVLSVLATMLRLLQRTDPVVAVRAFVASRRAAVLSAGARLGWMQREALRGRELVSGLGWATFTLTAPRVLRHEPIHAKRRGFLTASRTRLRKLQDLVVRLGFSWRLR